MNAQECARELGVTERTVRRWIERGDLPAEKHGGRFHIDPDIARAAYGTSRAGALVAKAGEVAELRGRLAEARDQIDRLEAALVQERTRRLAFERILYPQADEQYGRTAPMPPTGEDESPNKGTES